MPVVLGYEQRMCYPPRVGWLDDPFWKLLLIFQVVRVLLFWSGTIRWRFQWTCAGDGFNMVFNGGYLHKLSGPEVVVFSEHVSNFRMELIVNVLLDCIRCYWFLVLLSTWPLPRCLPNVCWRFSCPWCCVSASGTYYRTLQCRASLHVIYWIVSKVPGWSLAVAKHWSCISWCGFLENQKVELRLGLIVSSSRWKVVHQGVFLRAILG